MKSSLKTPNSIELPPALLLLPPGPRAAARAAPGDAPAAAAVLPAAVPAQVEAQVQAAPPLLVALLRPGRGGGGLLSRNGTATTAGMGKVPFQKEPSSVQ